MSLGKSIRKRYDWWQHVRFDRAVGFYKYALLGKAVYIRHPRHYVPPKMTDWVCRELYFRHYVPKDQDTVLDFGAGYNEEGVWLHHRSPGVRYLGVEIQPVMHECLANTYRRLGAGFRAIPYGLGPMEEQMRVASQFSYASSGLLPDGYIEVPTLSWPQMQDRYGIEQVDLLKMNIEGAEVHVLPQLDLARVRRAIISSHDSRADHGDGEQYRTKAKVIALLEEAGMKITHLSGRKSWMRDWLYAERPS